MTTQIRKNKSLNVTPDRGVSPGTSSPNLNIKIVGASIINGITLVRLRSKCKHRFQMKPYGGVISTTSAQLLEENQTLLQYTLM